MATYRSSFGALAIPTPAHALTPGAVAAVEAHRLIGLERSLQREVHGWIDGRGDRRGGIVTKHGNPKRSPWEGDPVTPNARRLLASAEAAGFTAHLIVEAERCIVEGYRLAPRREGFRATWVRGAASGGGFAWCEPWRYEIQDDDRPVGVDSVALVGKVGYRSPGVDRRHLRIVGSPWGLPIGYTELARRVRSAADEVPS
jgi:hypothetical protein